MRVFLPSPDPAPPGPCRHRGPWPHPALAAYVAGWLALSSLRAHTVAHWSFEPVPSATGATHLADAGPHGYTLVLGHGAAIVPGRTGMALRLTGGEHNGPAARILRLPPAATSEARPSSANFLHSPLNLGAADWSIDGWFRLEPGATNEGVVLEIGCDPRRPEDLSTRLSVLPREHAFLLSGLAPVRSATAPALARLVEFPNPEGPPAGVAHRFTAALVAPRPLPRGVWFHAAILHTGGRLHLVLDGGHCATTAVDLRSLPSTHEGYLSLGRDGNGRRPFPGTMDELRISDQAVLPVAPSAPGSRP